MQDNTLSMKKAWKAVGFRETEIKFVKCKFLSFTLFSITQIFRSGKEIGQAINIRVTFNPSYLLLQTNDKVGC